MSMEFGAGRLTELLAELEEEIRTAGAGETLDQMLPGLSEGQIRDALVEVALTPPEELLAWYQWHNGGHVMLTPFWQPMNLSGAIALYQEQELGTEDWQWRLGWLPIMGSHPFLLIDCSRPPSTPASVRRYNSWSGGFVSELTDDQPQPSLCLPVTWWIEALRTGVYRWEPTLNRWTGDRHGPLPPERLGLA